MLDDLGTLQSSIRPLCNPASGQCTVPFLVQFQLHTRPAGDGDVPSGAGPRQCHVTSAGGVTASRRDGAARDGQQRRAELLRVEAGNGRTEGATGSQKGRAEVRWEVAVYGKPSPPGYLTIL